MEARQLGSKTPIEIWTRKDRRALWTQWSDPLRGLVSLAEAMPEEVLVLATAPDVEHHSIQAALRLISKLVTGRPRVIVVTSHPSAAWIASLRGLGVDQFWVLAEKGVSSPAPTRNGTEVGELLCPALHTRTDCGVTLSVCGCRRDLMVLARHHFERWCLRNRNDCPHWLERGPRGDATSGPQE